VIPFFDLVAPSRSGHSKGTYNQCFIHLKAVKHQIIYCRQRYHCLALNPSPYQGIKLRFHYFSKNQSRIADIRVV
jgi:hypothetical protein